MDGELDEWMAGWLVGWLDRWMGEWAGMDGWMDGWMDGLMGEGSAGLLPQPMQTSHRAAFLEMRWPWRMGAGPGGFLDAVDKF